MLNKSFQHPEKAKNLIKLALFYFLIIIVSILIFIPIVSVFLTAIKSKGEFYSGKSIFQWPEDVQWSNFSNAIFKGRLGTYMLNGLFICAFKVPLGIFVEAMIAFAITRLDIKHKTAWFIFFILGMMLPMQTALVPLNTMFSRLGLINNRLALTYVYIGFGISFGVLILRGFFLGIPKELDEAAIVDGCNKWQLFTRIILPVAKPAVATLIISDVLATWNEYLLASVLITDSSKKTVPVGLLQFIGEHSIDYGLMCAGVLISIIPMIIVYIAFQQYFIEGMAGAIKG